MSVFSLQTHGNAKATRLLLLKFFQKTLKVCLAIHRGWWCSSCTAVAGPYLKEEFHWNTLANKEQHAPKTAYIFLNEKRKQIVRIRKEITKFGLDPNELGLFSKERYRENGI